MALAAAQALSGYADGTIRPDSGATRGELTKLLVRAFNLPMQKQAGPHFSDVPAGSAYYNYVEAAYSAGLLKGYKDGTFRADQVATRGALVKMVVKAAGWPVPSSSGSSVGAVFTDVLPGSPDYDNIQVAAAHGALQGYSEAKFGPDKPVERGLAALVVANAAPSLLAHLPESAALLLGKTSDSGGNK